jgi:hypothetical protein
VQDVDDKLSSSQQRVSDELAGANRNSVALTLVMSPYQICLLLRFNTQDPPIDARYFEALATVHKINKYSKTRRARLHSSFINYYNLSLPFACSWLPPCDALV